MHLKVIAIVCALTIAITTTATAQKKKIKKQPVATVADCNPGLKLYKSMIPSTAKLMFIDSAVVDKKNFFSHIPLPNEAGTLSMRDSMYSQYLNEFADQCFFAQGDSITSAIYSTDKLGGKWATPTQHFKNEKGFDIANYPFLMSDGVTLYFAAKGENSMGGYDIFMTTFDHDNGTFYSPENIGLPFNSTANDYLLAIDDIDKLGWLVTDRRQPNGKVCIYTFVPTDTRQDFSESDMTDSQIEHFSRILSISDTWKFGNRKAALTRLNNLKNRIATKVSKASSKSKFIINDNVAYNSADNFKSVTAKDLYNVWTGKKNTFEQEAIELEEARREYHKANNKQALAYKIKTLEKKHETLYTEIVNLEKKIRYVELNNQ